MMAIGMSIPKINIIEMPTIMIITKFGVFLEGFSGVPGISMMTGIFHVWTFFMYSIKAQHYGKNLYRHTFLSTKCNILAI